MAERGLPDLKSKITVDSSGLKKAEAEAKLSGAGMAGGLGKGSSAAKTLGKDLEDMGKKGAGGIPILGSLGSSIGGLPLPALAAAAAVGGLVLGGKAVIDVSDKWETAQRGLKQATDAVGGSYSDAQAEVQDFIDKNRKFVPSQAEVADSFAALTRQLGANGRITEDLNLALDLSEIKHISLKDATTALQGAEMGRGRALLQLGIQMKDYPVLMESAGQAAKKVEAAEKAVEKATIAHTDAVKKHGAASAQAKAAAVALHDANVKLAEAHNYAADRAKASAAIHELLHQKLDGGRKSTSDLTQTQNELGNVWQTFAQHIGPALTGMLDGLEKALLFVIEVILHVIDTMATWHGLWRVLGDIIGNVAGFLKVTFVEGVNIAKRVVEDISGVIRTLKGAFDDVVGAIQNVVHWLGQIKVPSINLPFGIGGPSGGGSAPGNPNANRSGGRAFGGWVVPGGIYDVGERGPEKLVMGSQGGYVVPNSGGSRSGSGGVTLHVHGFVGSPQQLFQVFREGIRRLDRGQT